MFDHNETLEQARARNIADALAEDIGRGDWTAQLVPAGTVVKAHVVAKEPALICGRDWFDGCVRALCVVALGQIADPSLVPKLSRLSAGGDSSLATGALAEALTIL